MAKHSNSKDAEFQTISYKLGKALLDAKNLDGLLRLPSKLIGLRKEVIERRDKDKIYENFNQLLNSIDAEALIYTVYKQYKLDGVLNFLNWHKDSDQNKAEMLLANAKYAEPVDLNAKKIFIQLAYKYDKSEKVLRACAWLAWKDRDIEKLEGVIKLLKDKGVSLSDNTYIETAIKFEKKITLLRKQEESLDKAALKKEVKSDVVDQKDDPIIPLKGEKFSEQVLEYYYLNGSKALLHKLKRDYQNLKKSELGFLLVRVGKVLSTEDLDAEVEFCDEALKITQDEKVLRGVMWAYQRSNQFDKAVDILSQLEEKLLASNKVEDKEILEKICRAPISGLLIEKSIIKQPIKKIDVIDKRVAYILHNSFPYSSGGYATRAFGVADGLRNHGYEVVIINRPGFPLDVKPELTASDVPEKEVISGFEYVRTLSPIRRGMPTYEYMSKAADALQKRFEEYRPAYVVAASNHLTAIPALIAAKRLGIPFIYEVRGFWEITRLSREPEYEKEPAFKIQVLLETMAANNADFVFTLTLPMLEELASRGVPVEKMALLPNSCTPEDFTPRGRNKSLARKLHIPSDVPVIGYIGTFVQYEGLDDLAEACGELKKKGLKFRLLLVGNENTSSEERGPITQKIIDIAKEYNYTEWLIMPGRVPHEEVEAYYSLIDVAPFPRKPQPVCEMVSPMKPLEASAMKKAIVVSSVRALTEMIVDGHTGLVFEKGNTKDLSEKLEILIADKKLRKALGENGRVWVEKERTWKLTTEKMVNQLSHIVAN